MASFQDILGLYDFHCPRERIAQAPADPRDSARLLVYDRRTGGTADAVFRDIGGVLPPRSLLVFNETKVIPAKLTLWRITGGMVSLLILGRTGELLRALADKKLRIGEQLSLPAGHTFTVDGSDGREWLLLPTFPAERWIDACEEIGEMPLPPYIKETPLSPAEQRREYQSVFARNTGSIAAPTASLHFTERLLGKLQKSGHDTAFVTLHVHLGTFAPLTEEQWKKGSLHREEYAIHPGTVQLIEQAKREKRPVIAVGTTVVRTLESASDANGHIVKPSGHTNLFIKEGYKFRLVDGLITNFHVPKSSLLMLVSAFASPKGAPFGGRSKILDLYRHALEGEYRFFSFGDGMMIL
ncbi:MAG: tRNA preQ1(34) S-adenosylmethionine ribosyltransferase-isomerase QueA [Candidatus Peribacteraceae bacterium]|jgi:S-adenosylmethionine:tRNA ribosyltransferase-isomerase